MNTAIIVAAQMADNPTGSFAARVCSNYSFNYGDWYLPSISELDLLYAQKSVVGGFSGTYYWSSTESIYDGGDEFALAVGFVTPNTGEYLLYKWEVLSVRAIRSF